MYDQQNNYKNGGVKHFNSNSNLLEMAARKLNIKITVIKIKLK